MKGKAKELFEKWYSASNAIAHLDNIAPSTYSMKAFYSLHSSMQWGVIQDWADSVGSYVNVFLDPTSDPCRFAWEVFDDKGNFDSCGGYETREEARSAAIEKLNQIINEK